MDITLRELKLGETLLSEFNAMNSEDEECEDNYFESLVKPAGQNGKKMFKGFVSAGGSALSSLYSSVKSQTVNAFHK